MLGYNRITYQNKQLNAMANFMFRVVFLVTYVLFGFQEMRNDRGEKQHLQRTTVVSE